MREEFNTQQYLKKYQIYFLKESKCTQSLILQILLVINSFYEIFFNEIIPNSSLKLIYLHSLLHKIFSKHKLDNAKYLKRLKNENLLESFKKINPELENILQEGNILIIFLKLMEIKNLNEYILILIRN